MNKRSRTSNDFLSLSYVSLSLIGLVILAVATYTSPTSTIIFNPQKQLTGSIFTAICLLGIIAGVVPSRCSRTPHFSYRKKANKQEQNDRETMIAWFVGHHPACGNFSAHILRLGSKTYCAGCTGLVLGAIISLIGILSYSFLDFNVGENAVLIFWVGFIAVACGLLQYHILDGNRGAVHFFFNVTFVLGAFLLQVGINEITGNFIVGFYLFTLIIYWIITRIMTSQLEHEKVCSTCSLKSCSYV